jgi:hypothetical protein
MCSGIQYNITLTQPPCGHQVDSMLRVLDVPGVRAAKVQLSTKTGGDGIMMTAPVLARTTNLAPGVIRLHIGVDERRQPRPQEFL